MSAAATWGWLLGMLLLSVQALPADEFTIGRVKYDGGGDWYSDPTSLPNLLVFISRETGISCSEEEQVVELDDPELYSLPCLYLTGHGRVEFNELQIERLRDYLNAGGFMHVDDNYGLDEHFRREILKVFPEHELQLVPFDHPLYHSWFDYSEGLPKIHEHDKKPPAGYGIFIEGRLALFYTHECDLGDGWEDEIVHGDAPDLRRKALEMGANIFVYALGGGPDKLN